MSKSSKIDKKLLTGFITHEMGTSLQILKGYLELFCKEHEAYLFKTEKCRKKVKIFGEEIEHLFLKELSDRNLDSNL